VSRHLCLLLSVCLLVPRIAGQRKPNESRPADAGVQAGSALDEDVAHLVYRLESRIDASLLPPVPPQDFYKAHVPAKPCDVVSEHTKLAQAWDKYQDRHLDAAVNQFSNLTASCDPRVKYIAVMAFGRTQDEISNWWQEKTIPLVNELESRIDSSFLPSAPADAFYKTQVPAKTCDIVSEHTKLAQAWDEYKDVHLDAAVNQFSSLTASCDPRVRYVAVLAFGRTHHKMSSWWWQMGRYFPPLRWADIDFPRRVGRIVLYVVFIILALKMLRPAFEWTVQSYYGWRPPKRITIMTPTALTTGEKAAPEVDFFAAMLQDSCDKVSRQLSREGMGLQVSATSFLSVSSTTAESLKNSIPSIKGVDLNAFAKFFFYLVRYFSPRIESQVALCQPVANTADGGKSTAPQRLVAYATLRVLWVVIGNECFVDVPVDNQYDIEGAVFFLAVQILGNRRPVGKEVMPFPDQKSFSYYMQGLGALLLYEQEAAKDRPRRAMLECWMQSALSHLRKCATQHKGEPPVTRFSYGIMLAMRNQEIYVERLQEIKSACVAAGRRLGFADMILRQDSDKLQQCLSVEEELSRPFYDLAKAQWPYIIESANMFQSVIANSAVEHERSLEDRARYNLAEAYARRGRKQDLEKARQQLEQGPADHSDDDPGLAWQFACLRESVQVRWLKEQHPKNAEASDMHLLFGVQVGNKEIFGDINLDRRKRIEDTQKAFAEFHGFRKRLPVDLPPAARRDLIADHLTQEGYIYMVCAAELFPIDGSVSAEELLEKAAKDFTNALAIKPNWNPAQIYLALTRRIQSGLADAYVEYLNLPEQAPKPSEDDKPAGAQRKSGAAAGHHSKELHKAPATPVAPTNGATSNNDARQDSYKRTREEEARRNQSKQFRQEADDLFAALQGNDWPRAKSDSETTTGTPQTKSSSAANGANQGGSAANSAFEAENAKAQGAVP
jgi:hypothetical protein